MIKRIESGAIDLDKLARLQKLHADDVFCQTAYFQSLFQHWCALVLDDYKAVFLIPYKTFGPWKWSFTPMFYRASYWLGTWSDSDKNEALELLKNSFDFGALNVGCVSGLTVRSVHQIILSENQGIESYNKLARRMIRKAQQHDILLINELDVANFVQFLHRELNEKVAGINDDSMRLFSKLLYGLQKQGCLRFEGAILGGVLVAGILVVEGQGRHVYLKGTATQDAKKIGVYYWLMHRAVKRAQEQGAIFDFGGSSIEGVAQFNRNFGAQDDEYAHFVWGKQPRLFAMIKRILKAWK